MRIKHEEPPKMGDKRERTGFLYLPKTIGLETRWLEFASWREEYFPTGYVGDSAWYPFEWL